MKRTEIEKLLPEVIRGTLRRGNPLSAVLEVMEALHEPSEEILGQLDAVFDPYRSRDDFVSFLAQWVDLEWLLEKPHDVRPPSSSLKEPMPTGLGRLRELIASAVYLSQWRGTGKGLLLFLRIATGVDGFRINEEVMDDAGQPRPFHIRILVPQTAKVHEDLIKRIVEKEKPAYVTYDFGKEK